LLKPPNETAKQARCDSRRQISVAFGALMFQYGSPGNCAASIRTGVIGETMVGQTKTRIPYSPEPSGGDLRELPLYSLSEISYFLGIPKQTLHRWTRVEFNRRGETVDPLIEPADRQAVLFSFYNLSEVHILSATIRFHKLKPQRVRDAMKELRALALSNPRHPLLSREFYTDGRDLFVKTVEGRKKQTINISRFGQLGLTEILDSYLERIERDSGFNPIKLFPIRQSGKVVSIMPTVSSGRPVIDSAGIPVAAIWSRRCAGDSVETIADDYEIPESEIEGAIAYIEQLAA
jgi:uncharacterized protein (DUF433 family)